MLEKIKSSYRKYSFTYEKGEIIKYDIALNNPATDDEIQLFHISTGIHLPNDLVELYKIHNGELIETERTSGVLGGFDYLPLKECLCRYNIEKEVAVVNKLAGIKNEITVPNLPEQTVRPFDFNNLWIPFGASSDGKLLAIDLDPDEKGNMGQVINIGGSMLARFQLARSLEEFLSLVESLLLSGEMFHENEDTDIVEYFYTKYGFYD